jgi:hypothetical protein
MVLLVYSADAGLNALPRLAMQLTAIDTEECDSTTVRRHRTIHHVQQRAFARPARSDQSDTLVCTNAQADIS